MQIPRGMHQVPYRGGSQHTTNCFGPFVGPHQEGFQSGALVVLLAVFTRPTVPVHRYPTRASPLPPGKGEVVLIRIRGGIHRERETTERGRQRREQEAEIGVATFQQLRQHLRAPHLGGKVPRATLRAYLSNAAVRGRGDQTSRMEDAVHLTIALLEPREDLAHPHLVGDVAAQHHHLATRFRHAVQGTDLLAHLILIPVFEEPRRPRVALGKGAPRYQDYIGSVTPRQHAGQREAYVAQAAANQICSALTQHILLRRNLVQVYRRVALHQAVLATIGHRDLRRC